ncbi:ice-binding protein, partial [Mycena metata]
MHINSVFVLLAYTGYSLAGQNAPVLLGAAGNFAILARSGVENVPTSAISGNVGVSPKTASSLTGFDLVQDPSGQFSTSTQVNGRLMGSTDAPPTPSLLSAAVLDMQNAFADAMNQHIFIDFGSISFPGRIGGANLIPGIYKWTTGVTIASGITLTGGPTDTWIFQVSGSLNQAADVTINLSGGALPQNIFWAVAGTVTLNNNTVFQGNILTKTNIDIGFNAVNNGCLYAQTAVFMKQATILCPGGVVTPPPTSSAPTAPPSTSATPTSTVTTTTVTPQCTATASSTAC